MSSSGEALGKFMGKGTIQDLLDERPVIRTRRLLSDRLAPGLFAIIDACVCIVACIGVYWLHPGWNPDQYQLYLSATLLNAVIIITLFHSRGLYDFQSLVSWPTQLPQCIWLNTVSIIILLFLGFSFKISDQFSRIWFFGSWLVTIVFICFVHSLAKALTNKWVHDGIIIRNLAIIGAGSQASQLLAWLNERSVSWKRIIGVFDDRRTRISQHIEGYPVIGGLHDLEALVRRGEIDDVVIAFPWSAEQRIAEVIERLRPLPVGTYLCSDLIGYRFVQCQGKCYGKLPLLELLPKPLSDWDGVVKIIEDKILAGILVIVMSPLMLLIALGIKLDSRGPILFRQQRYGFNNEVISIYKFRTMYHNRPPDVGVAQATQKDPRVTRFGRFLRRTSLDELPQLFNVLEGTMSLVGPRPHPIELNRKFAAFIRNYYSRHKVKPGITGWAQVNGYRGETETTEKMRARVEHDIYYIENWSLWMDICILIKTVFVGFLHKNAY